MKIENILEAKKEAERFLERINNLANSKANSRKFSPVTMLEKDFTVPSKETGALKRSSMDLTRSLSKLRQETY